MAELHPVTMLVRMMEFLRTAWDCILWAAYLSRVIVLIMIPLLVIGFLVAIAEG